MDMPETEPFAFSALLQGSEQRFLTKGGAAWATGGLSLFYEALISRLTTFVNPCESVLKVDASQQI